jgi:hypothetical protein
MTIVNAPQRSDLLARHHCDKNSKIGLESNNIVLFWTQMYAKKFQINLPPPYEKENRRVSSTWATDQASPFRTGFESGRIC